MSKKVAFIGHRTIGYGPIKERLKDAIQQELNSGCRYFTMGTHGEFDSMALNCCRDFRKIYKDIEIEVVITSLNKIKKVVDEDDFGRFDYTPYNDVKTVMYEIEDEHYKRQIIASNKQMIDTCDTLICYVNKNRSPSGARTAMNYAKRKGLNIINLYHEEDEPTFGMTKEEKEEYFKNFDKNLNK
jgi:uncharacterized phage-like protein YoqJ